MLNDVAGGSHGAGCGALELESSELLAPPEAIRRHGVIVRRPIACCVAISPPLIRTPSSARRCARVSPVAAARAEMLLCCTMPFSGSVLQLRVRPSRDPVRAADDGRRRPLGRPRCSCPQSALRAHLLPWLLARRVERNYSRYLADGTPRFPDELVRGAQACRVAVLRAVLPRANIARLFSCAWSASPTRREPPPSGGYLGVDPRTYLQGRAYSSSATPPTLVQTPPYPCLHHVAHEAGA